MLRVSLEHISARDGHTEIIGTATITNDGVGSKALGNYLIHIQDKKGITFRSARVLGFPRLQRNAWHLLYLALRDAGMAQC